MSTPVSDTPVMPFVNIIPKWGEPYTHVLNRASVLEALTDYILQVNYRGYTPDPRKVLAIHVTDRTASVRNAGTPIRHEVYYYIEGELFPLHETTSLHEGQSARELAEFLLEQCYEQLVIWAAYDITKGSPPGFRRPFDYPLIVEGSGDPNSQQITRSRPILAGINPAFFQPDPIPPTQIDADFRADLTTDAVATYVNHLVETDFRNLLPEGDNPPIFATPIIGIASARDPLFSRFQDAEVVGPCHRLPREWQPGAESIISAFFPFSAHIDQRYSKDSRYSALEFSSGKWNGSKFLNVVRRGLIRFLEQHGGEGVAPNIDARYDSDGYNPFWSERHAAFAAGVGTFGLHQGLITAKGVLGRICSVITTVKLLPTIRPYRDVYGYCLYAFNGKCRACIDRCPVQAITDAGKRPGVCGTHGNNVHFSEWGYSSCGHCSTFVPCSRAIPAPIKAHLAGGG